MNESTNVPVNPAPAAPMQAPATACVPPAPGQKPVYTVTEGVCGLLFFLLGWLFVRAVLTVAPGVGATLYSLALTVLSLVFLAKSGCRLRWQHWLWAGVITLFSAGFTLQGSAAMSHLNLLFVGVTSLLWCTAVGDGRGGVFRSLILTDLIKATLLLPFTAFGAGFGALKGLLSRGKRPAWLGYTLLGLLAALIPTLLVGTLLSSADVAFEELLSLLFTDIFSSVWTFVWQLALGVPVACYLFGLLYSSAHGSGQQLLSDGSAQAAALRMRKVPAAAWYAGITPLCVLYSLFFVAQFAYFTDAFRRLLPEGYSYAEYAREGFFQLCAVAVINLLVLGLLRLTVRRPPETGRLPVAARIYGTVLSVFTLLLVVTALRKMILYVEQLGLTRLRVYTSVFMLLIAAVFVLSLAALWWRRVSVVRGGAAVAAVLFGVMLFGNVDACIARYNTESYKNGVLSEVDIRALYRLGDAAVPCLAELADSDDPAVAGEAALYLEELFRHREERSRLSFNLTAYRADRALEDYYGTHPHISGTEFMARCEAYDFWEYCSCEECCDIYYPTGYEYEAV